MFQNEGGPCGLLATVHAFYLKHLLFVNKVNINLITKQHQENFIASAITDTLMNAASETKSGDVTLVVIQGAKSGKIKPISPTQCQKIMDKNGEDLRKQVLGVIKSQIRMFVEQKGQGVILVVYSVILTRGIAELAADMDMPDCALINEYGYAS